MYCELCAFPLWFKESPSNSIEFRKKRKIKKYKHESLFYETMEDLKLLYVNGGYSLHSYSL